MEITFEKANLDDSEKLLEIQKESFQEALLLYKDYETNPAFESIKKITYKIQNHKYYKIIADGNIVGGIHIYKKGENHYYLNRIFVHPQLREFGYRKNGNDFYRKRKDF